MYSAQYWKNCATCDHWQGPRVVNALGTASDVVESAEGTCRQDPTRHRHWATNSCRTWQIWHPLR
jgi:hypothetical protein